MGEYYSLLKTENTLCMEYNILTFSSLLIWVVDNASLLAYSSSYQTLSSWLKIEFNLDAFYVLKV